MRTPFYCLFLFCSALLCASAYPQAADPAATPVAPPAPPPGPLIQKRAPDFAIWSIVTTASVKAGTKSGQTSSPRNGSDDSQASVTRVNTSKTGKVVRVERIDEKQQTWNVWWSKGSAEILVTPDGKVAALASSNNPDAPNPYHTDFSSSDFQGFEWIAASNYTGIEKYMGMNCLAFKKDLAVRADSASPRTIIVPVRAYVEIQSRLPIALVRGDQTSVYEWKSPPDAVLQVPTEVQNLLNQRSKSFELMATKGARPY